MSGIENYPTLQVIISILLIIVSVLIMITSIIIRKKRKRLKRRCLVDTALNRYN